MSLVDIGVLNRIDLSGLEYKVLFAMLQRVPEKGGIEARVSVAEIANAIGVHPQSVSRVLKDLRGRHIVRTERVGVHQINPWIAYNGDFDSWNSESDGWPEPIWMRVDTETGEVK